MRISEIIKLEDTNPDSIILIKEGLFLRAYEQSAFRFMRLIRDYRVLLKHFKNIDRTVAYLGFPSEKLPSVIARAKLQGWKAEEREPGVWIIRGFPEVEGYESWKECLPEKTARAKKTKETESDQIKENPMQQVSILPVYKDAYDLMLEIFQYSKQFQREYRFTLGERLKNEVLELLIKVYEAQMGYDRQKNILRARKHAELSRLLIRLTKDLRLIDLKRFIRMNDNIEKILRQLSGWLKVQTQCRSPVGQGH